MKKIRKKYKKTRVKRSKKTSVFGWIVWSIIGLLLLPLLASVFIATSMLLWQIPLFSSTIAYIVIGMVLYSVFHLFIYQPIALYVMAHEFTHAAFAMLLGIRVRKIKVSAQGGYVEMTRSNFVIDLAPYFFPLYTVILTSIFYTLDRIYSFENYYWLFFIFVGISFAFHILSNWDVLQIEQPDLNTTGKVFGIIFVLILNIIFANLILMIIFIDYVNLQTLAENFYYSWEHVYKTIIN